MRIEQLVLYGPGDDDRVRFGPGVTVFAGLGPSERTDLVETVVDALTGRLSNASVVYTDHRGRRVFADRTGATFATTGSPAPAPRELLGADPATVSALLTLTAADLGLGQRVSAADLGAELATARADLERLQAEHADVTERAGLVTTWQTELAELSRRIERADEDAARWAWVKLRRHLDEVRAELNMLDSDDRGCSDRRVLQAVDALRIAGQTWADLAAAAAALRAELGDLPAVSSEDLARVAATPAELPAGFDARMEYLQAATDLRWAADAELAEVPQVAPEADDELVAAFAAIDQEQLWAAHRRIEEAVEAYDQVAAAMQQGELAPEVEDRIEEAHLEVVRRQREVERRFRPGVLSASALAVAALLAGNATSVLLGVVALVASVAMAAWLLVAPRRSLAAAQAVEDEALAQADAGSWLGLHLRRLDAVEDVPERERFEEVANARAAAQVDWDEVAGGLDPADLTLRADPVRAHADATDPQAIARRLDEARAFSAAAHEAEAAARTSLTSGLDAYGLALGGGSDLDPYQLATLLHRRIEAGAVARRAKKLAILEQREAEAGRKLGDVLTHLGYTDGDLDGRLARAVAAVAAAKRRQEAGTRSRADIEQEVAVLERRVRAEAQQGWADDPDPSSAPTDPLLLEARRREIGELVNAAGRPDVVGAERRCDVALSRVNDLEARLAELANGPGSLQQRLISRLGRTTWSADHEESVPVFVDEALVAVPVAERMDLLDLVVRLTEHVQVVLLTEDPVVARWARDRATHDNVTLYEAQPTVDASDPGPVAEAAARVAELDGVPFEGFRATQHPSQPHLPTLVHAPLN